MNNLIKKISIVMLCLYTITTRAATIIVDNYTTQPQGIDVISAGNTCAPFTQISLKPSQRNIAKDIGAACNVKEIRMFGANQALRYTDSSDNANKNFRVSILATGSMIVAGKGFVEKIFEPTFDLNAFVRKQGYKNLTVDKETGIIRFKNK